MEYPITGKTQSTFSNHNFTDAGSIKNVFIANEQVENITLNNAIFDLSIFIGISFKETKLSNCKFVHCIFFNCYFRKTELSTVDFTGSTFVSCQFPKIKIRQSIFDYCNFEKCIIPFEEIEHSLPTEPNLKHSISRNLKLQCVLIGSKSQYLNYFNQEMAAKEEHLKSIILRKSSHYKEKYDLCSSFVAANQYLSMKFSKLIWGYGEEIRPLLVTSFIIIPIAFALIYWQLQGFTDPAGKNITVNLNESFGISYCSISLSCMHSYIASSSLVFIVKITQSLLNIVLFGLFISGLHKWIQR